MISLVWILVLVFVECSIYTNCLSVASFVFFSLPVFSEGIYWMSIVSPKLIYCCSNRVIEVFSLNHLCDFWALSRCSVTSLSLVTCKGKSSRVMAIGNDSRLVKHPLLCGLLKGRCHAIRAEFQWGEKKCYIKSIEIKTNAYVSFTGPLLVHCI